MAAQKVKPAQRFNTRAFVALSLVLGGLGLPVTGIMNHVHQTDPITVRHGWMAAHNGLALLFVVFAIWHVVLNWKALVRHIGAGARQMLATREAIGATALVALVLVVAVGHTLH